MADLHPFRGIRYVPEQVPDLSKVVCLPQDALSAHDQFRYHLRDPHNAVRLEFAQAQPDDDFLENRYTRAAATLRQWLETGIMRRDSLPDFYLYEQEFRGKVRRGFFSLVRIAEAASDIVRPLAPLRAEIEAERLQQLRNFPVNVSPLLAIYEDPDQIVAELLLEASLEHPFVSFADDAGTQHRLWRLLDPTRFACLQEELAATPVYLVDGQHRYAAARAYRDWMNQAGGDPEAGLHNFVMTVLVDAEDPGLALEPVHRLVKIETLPPDFLDLLARHFEVERHAIDPELPWPEQIEAQLERQSADPTVRMGLLLGTEIAYYTLRPRAGLDRGLAGHHPDWAELDAALLHHVILDGLLAIPAPQWEPGGRIAYARDPREVLMGLGSGQFQLAFLLSPPRIDHLIRVAAAGETPPDRSYELDPLLPTGLVLHPLEGKLTP